MSEQRIIRLKEVLKRIPVSRSTIYSFMARGQFPPAIPLGPRAIGWLESDIDQWIAERRQTATWTVDSVTR